MSSSDEMNYQNSMNCKICKRIFSSEIIKVRHHCHYEKKQNYIGALCQRCNLSIKRQNKLISVCHNSSYDIGLILKFCSSKYSFKALPKKSHLKFYNILVNNKIKIIDSLNFLGESLQKLIDNHIKAGLKFDITKKILSSKNILPNSELYDLLISGKPAMCYDYISDINKLSETKLPNKNQFFNTLRNTAISEEHYINSNKIYELSKCKNIGDYLILYNNMDVLLLCDIFLTWRKTFFENYHLDIAQYLTISAYSFDACLFRNAENTEIDLLHDPELIGIINHNIRGGYCCLNKKYGKFDNFFTVRDKIKRTNLKKNTYCFYLDVNSLYSKAMSENLPYKDIEECNKEEYLEILKKMCDPKFEPKNATIGYWLLVDFHENSDLIQDKTDQYPLAFENVTITNKHLSPYTKTLLKHDQRNFKFDRLIGHHDVKNNYLVTGENFHFYNHMGMKVKKIHRIFKFQQKPFLKEYIDSNIEKRKMASNNLESHLYKLCNNSIFGKLMCSALNYSYKTDICTDRAKFNKLIKSEKFKQCHILSNDKAIVISEKKSVRLNFPNYVGFHILEKSKRINYELIYNFIFKYLKHFDPQIYYTDTDSLIISLSVQTNSCIQSDFKRAYNQYNTLISELIPILDTSNFHPNHPFYNTNHQKEYGLLKSEFPLNIISEFCGLRPKSYSLLLSDYMIHNVMETILDILDLQNDIGIINLVINDTQCAIFSVDKSFVSHNVFINKVIEAVFELTSYYQSNLSHETFNSRKPTEKIYYDNEIYTNIINNSNIDSFNYYYVEICKKFNIFLYEYKLDLVTRPINNTYSYWELLFQKTKTAAGVPFHLRNKMSHKDYNDTLISRNQNNSKIKYNIIKNDKGCVKMTLVTKDGLFLKDVKRYWVNDTTSYAFFSDKLGCDKLRFEQNIYSDSDIDSNHSNCENNDNDDQTGYNDRVNCDEKIKISLFEKRIKKYNYLFCKKTNNHPTNITNDINHSTNINIPHNVTDDMNPSINIDIPHNVIDGYIESDCESDQSIIISRKRANPFCISDSDVTDEQNSYIDSDYYDEIIDKKKQKKNTKTRNPYIISEAYTENNMSDDLENSSSSNSIDNSFIDNDENVISSMSDYLFYLKNINKK